VLLMIVIAVVVFGVAVAIVWFVLARGSSVSETTEQEFDDAYDELVAEGTLDDGDRAAAWRDFHAWQVKGEGERSSGEDPAEE
jgi:hypothetical protein